jgi:hypothetical protein
VEGNSKVSSKQKHLIRKFWEVFIGIGASLYSKILRAYSDGELK